MTMHFVNMQQELLRRSLRMASLVEDVVHESCDALFATDASLALRVIERDEEVDRVEVEIEEDAIRLMALNQPVGRDLRVLCTVLKVNSVLECIADCAVNVAERAKHQLVQPLARCSDELQQMIPAVRQALRRAVQAYGDTDIGLARRVIEGDELIDALYGQVVQDTVVTADRSLEGMAAHLDLLSVAKNLERVADHATNIARNVIYVATGEIVRHCDKQRVGAERRASGPNDAQS